MIAKKERRDVALDIAGQLDRRHQQGLGCHKGLSDLTAIKGGKTVYIEVKNIFGKLSEKQIEFKSDIENHGGIYLVVRSIADIEAEFSRYHL